MTEPQTWTIIVILGGAFFTALILMSTLFTRVVRAEISGLRGELGGEISGLRGELGGEISGLRGELRAEIGGLRKEMNARFDAVNVRIDNLDRDVQFLMAREAER